MNWEVGTMISSSKSSKGIVPYAKVILSYYILNICIIIIIFLNSYIGKFNIDRCRRGRKVTNF